MLRDVWASRGPLGVPDGTTGPFVLSHTGDWLTPARLKYWQAHFAEGFQFSQFPSGTSEGSEKL